MNTLSFGIMLLILGLLIGMAIGWLMVRLRYQNIMISKNEIDQQFVAKGIHEHIQKALDIAQDDLEDKNEQIIHMRERLSSQQQIIFHLEEQMAKQKNEIQNLQEKFKTEFENIANRLLEEKSQKFTAQNQEQLGHLLHPLREKIKAFEDGVERRFLEETKDRVSLKKEIEHLRHLNQQLSQDANNLVSALKGENKMQGDWGEFQLELLLEKAGLQKGTHYQVQNSFRDEEGRHKRPDFIINLPDDKHLIIDSKVSLVAYERYFNSHSEEEKRLHLKDHLNSIKQHIKDLSSKNYQRLYQINSPDYLLLFVPIEPAFAIAAQEDHRLFLDALDRNVVLVSTSTLLATMRTVSYIWTQDKQKRSVLEIARQSGMLYDKFCGFVDDLKSIGQKLDHAQSAYKDAMNKLVDSRKFGDTLIGRAEKIKELGAKATKQLPKELLDR